MTSASPAAPGGTGAAGGGLIDALRRALRGRTRVPMQIEAVPAAVLIPLFLKDGEYHIIFTKRTAHLTHHSGEISFPGGVAEAEDASRAETALRETFEEIGIPPESVEVLGLLDDFRSLHGYLVTPVVGVVTWHSPLTVNLQEIERVIEAPLFHFLQEGVLRIEEWPPWKPGEKPMYFFDYRGDEIWGLTARMLKQFLDIVAELPEVKGIPSPPRPSA